MVPMPVHLLGLELSGFIAGGDGGMSVGIAFGHPVRTADRLRRQRRSLRGSGQRGSSCRNAQCKFQKVPTLHDISFGVSSK